MTHSAFLSFWRFFSVVALLCVHSTALASEAYVHDALSYALEGSEEYVEGSGTFTLRKDFWQGKSASGKAHAIKHHLVKGNEYWFWVGTDANVEKMAIAFYDEDGEGLKLEIKKGKRWIGARVEVAKSGSYYIAFRITTKDGQEAHWAVAYAFK